jgi:hypothetical protein
VKTWIVTYLEADENPLSEEYLFFQCEADDAEHAREQFENAEPAAQLLWVECQG